MTAAAKAHYPSRAQIKRALDVWRSDVGKVGGYEIGPDGTIRVFSERSAPSANDAYERWAAKDAG